MSARLRVELLGGFRALRTDAASCALPTRKCEALLAYLSLPAGRPHARDSLAALLWGDTGEPQARQSLRQALRHLRLALGEGVIVTRGDTVSLETGAVVVDVGELEAGLAEPTLAGLERAVDLYKGEFLAGVRVSEQPFEEWLTVHRERIHELVLDALVRILREQMRADRPEAAIQTARRMLALDPLQEPIHRALMRLLLRLGRRGAALQQYQACLVSLRRELGTEPDEETRRLYQEILLTMGSATAREWSTGTRAVDTPAFGRTVELEALDTVTSRVLDTGGRVVLITGEAGIGKSRLLQESLTRAAARGARILFGRCHQTEQTLPFRPWIEALRGDGRGLEPAVRDRLSALARTQIAALCPELIPADAVTPPAAAPALLFDPILELVAALAAEQPLIVAIEDLHWADTMSARLLAFLGRRLARWPVLLVGTLRPEDAVDIPAMGQAIRELRADGRLDEVTLGPLSETDSQMLAEALWPSARARDDWDRVKSQVWTLSG